MANKEHLELLKQNVDAWNRWREENKEIIPDLKSANLRESFLMEANLYKAKLTGALLREAMLVDANLKGAELNQANLRRADLRAAKLTGANLIEADFTGANLSKADLEGSNLSGANFFEANLNEANFTGANLKGANLSGAICVNTDFANANIENAIIYGISVWDINIAGLKQRNLIITKDGDPTITVDNIEVAQFIYLMLNNKKIRDVIGTIAKKGVLILGRFSPERKKILDTIRDKLRKHDFVPIMFDFEKVTERDFTETIKVLAGMSRFVIVDITNPSSSPLELQATVPDYKIPFIPIIQTGEKPFSMFNDLQSKFHWVLNRIEYDSEIDLLDGFEKGIIERALASEKRLLEERLAPPPNALNFGNYKKNDFNNIS